MTPQSEHDPHNLDCLSYHQNSRHNIFLFHLQIQVLKKLSHMSLYNYHLLFLNHKFVILVHSIYFRPSSIYVLSVRFHLSPNIFPQTQSLYQLVEILKPVYLFLLVFEFLGNNSILHPILLVQLKLIELENYILIKLEIM
jgi:hypothetical protein